MNATKTKTAIKAKAAAELRASGAELAKREDRYGDTRTGWWIDGVWLAPANDPAAALRTLHGAN